MLRVCLVSFNIQRSFLLLLTAASDLLLHKILLNFVLLSPIVSGGVCVSFQQKYPPRSVVRLLLLL